jgi:hypothetical protein
VVLPILGALALGTIFLFQLIKETIRLMFTINPKTTMIVIEATTNTPVSDDSFVSVRVLCSRSDDAVREQCQEGTAIFLLETLNERMIETLMYSLEGMRDPNNSQDDKDAFKTFLSGIVGRSRLIRPAAQDDDDALQDDDDDWRSEIAMQAGMMGGTAAYNEVMGYDVGCYDEEDY